MPGAYKSFLKLSSSNSLRCWSCNIFNSLWSFTICSLILYKFSCFLTWFDLIAWRMRSFANKNAYSGLPRPVCGPIPCWVQFLFGTFERRIGDLLFAEDGDLFDFFPDKSILVTPGESFFIVLIFLNPGLVDFLNPGLVERLGEEGTN